MKDLFFDPSLLTLKEKPRHWFLGFEVPYNFEKKLRSYKLVRYPKDERLKPALVYSDGTLGRIPSYVYELDGVKVGYEFYEAKKPLVMMLGEKVPARWKTLLKVAAKYPPEDPNPTHTYLMRMLMRAYISNKKARHQNRKKKYNLNYFKCHEQEK